MSEQQFLELVTANQGIIYKIVSLYATDKEEKKDLYQEILLQAWKSIGNFQGMARFSTWLYRVAINTMLTYKRKGNIIEYKESLDEYVDQFNDFDITERMATIREVLKQLPDIDKAIATMHLDGYDNHEISGILGITANNVAVKLHRIKKFIIRNSKY